MKPVLEHILLDGKKSIHAFRYSNDNFVTPWHYHPQYELTLIEESVGSKFVGDYVGPYEPGELVLIGAYLPHCWKNQAQNGSKCVSTVIQWSPAAFSNVLELQPVSALLKKSAFGIVFESSKVEFLKPRLLALPSLGPGECYIELLSILLILSECNQTKLSAAKFEGTLPKDYNTRMAKIHEFIADHYSRKVYLAELAILVNMSEQSFSRFFSKMMGRPFVSFLNEYRINISGQLLIETDKSIGEIGYACGYESLPFFYRQFKKFKGDSPAHYRKLYRSEM